MARQLHSRGLRPEQRSVVDEAQTKKEIDYRQENQIKGVQDIVHLVAVDPPIAIVTRLISAFNKVTSCVRRNNEHLNRFVDRFRGVASEHLMHAGASSSSQIGEVLAITMLNNAKLEEGTLTNAKMQLIGLAESRLVKNNGARDQLRINKSICFDHSVVVKVMKWKEQSEIVSSLSIANKNTSKADQKAQVRSFHSSLKSLLSLIADITVDVQGEACISAEADKSGEEETIYVSSLFSAPQKYTLLLDDAVSVLRLLAMNSTATESAIDRHQVQNIVTKNIQKAMFAFNKQSPFGSNPGSSSNQQKKSAHVAAGRVKRGNKAGSASEKVKNKQVSVKLGLNNFCYDCGAVDEKRGHEGCTNPSFLTRKMKAENKKGNQESTAQEDQYFRPGSNKKE